MFKRKKKKKEEERLLEDERRRKIHNILATKHDPQPTIFLSENKEGIRKERQEFIGITVPFAWGMAAYDKLRKIVKEKKSENQTILLMLHKNENISIESNFKGNG